jgi:ribosomal protein S18 acetylase RimI-like enzyme
MGEDMLDKSVPYKRVIMKLNYSNNNFSKDINLPEGYSFKMYEPGFENYWAETETEVLEYKTKEEAIEYFKKELIPYQEQLKKRMVFIMNQEGVAVANACAWYINYKGRHQAHVHFVAVRPDYQGRGLGKAIFAKILTIFSIYEAGEDIYLHTQTWSHVAIRMYLKMGFKLIKDDSLGYHDKNYEEAVEVLDGIYDEGTMKLIRGNKYKYKFNIMYKSIIQKVESVVLSNIRKHL